MRTIMAIFAHPDDEGVVGGTMAYYADQGDATILVCATRGEVGQISDPSLATPETLGEVRQKELETACQSLGIKHLEFLDRRDSGMDGTDENKEPRAFIQSNPEEVIGQLVGLMRRYQPDVVITFEPYGWYGHPDHKMTSKWVTEAYPLVSDATAYPEQGAVWQPQKLFHSMLTFKDFQDLIEKAIEMGYFTKADFDEFPQELDAGQLETEKQITHVIDVTDYFDQQQEAMRAHQTQFGDDNLFRKVPIDLMRPFWGIERYIQVYPTPDPAWRDNPLTDLFA